MTDATVMALRTNNTVGLHVEADGLFSALHALPAFDGAILIDRCAPAHLVRQLASAIGVSIAKVCTLLGIRRATVTRAVKVAGRLPRAESEGALGLARLFGQVSRSFGNPGTRRASMPGHG